MTEVVMLVSTISLDTSKRLDRELFQHVSYVANRILMIAKKDGISKNTLIEMGKYLWRFIRVLQAYNHKKRSVTLEEIVSIVEEFKSIFGG